MWKSVNRPDLNWKPGLRCEDVLSESLNAIDWLREGPPQEARTTGLVALAAIKSRVYWQWQLIQINTSRTQRLRIKSEINEDDERKANLKRWTKICHSASAPFSPQLIMNMVADHRNKNTPKEWHRRDPKLVHINHLSSAQGMRVSPEVRASIYRTVYARAQSPNAEDQDSPFYSASNYIGGHHLWGDSRSYQVPRSQCWISSQLKQNFDCRFERGPMKTNQQTFAKIKVNYCICRDLCHGGGSVWRRASLPSENAGMTFNPTW